MAARYDHRLVTVRIPVLGGPPAPSAAIDDLVADGYEIVEFAPLDKGQAVVLARKTLPGKARSV